MQKQNKQKLGFLGNDITHTRIGLRTHEFSLHVQARSYICRSLPKNLKTQKQSRNQTRYKNHVYKDRKETNTCKDR